MTSFKQARLIVEKELNKWGDDSEVKLAIFDSLTIETKICWVFFYGDLDIELAGNAPFIVDKEYGNLYETGTSEGTKYYLKAFKKLYKKYKNRPEELRAMMPI